MSKVLVIDASVARSAGETEHPVSSACRQTLTSVLKICHKMVTCKEIDIEWKNHQSNFALKWRAAMQSKGKIVRIQISEDSALPDKLKQLNLSHKKTSAMLKDAHLIEAARQTGLRVISTDETVRALFQSAAMRIDELKSICWVNPTSEIDNCLEWLNEGAKISDRPECLLIKGT